MEYQVPGRAAGGSAVTRGPGLGAQSPGSASSGGTGRPGLGESGAGDRDQEVGPGSGTPEAVVSQIGDGWKRPRGSVGLRRSGDHGVCTWQCRAESGEEGIRNSDLKDLAI